MDGLVKQLFQADNGQQLIFAGQGADPTLGEVDRVALSVAVKDTVYQKLLSHNKYVANKRTKYRDDVKARKGEAPKQNGQTPSTDQATADTTNKAED